MSKHTLAVLVAVSIPIGMVVAAATSVGEAGLVVMAAALVVASRTVPRFRWDLLRGAVAGAGAGLVVLGPGFRIAMRVVAIADPTRRPEFTFEGTMFIIVGVGLMFGAVAGAYVLSVGRLLELRRPAIALLATAGLMIFLFGDSELRAELTDLGAGGWMNVPMFGLVVFAYGWAVDRIAVRLEEWAADRARRRTELAGVS